MTHPDVPTRFRTFVRRENLLEPNDRILLAVSGGLDSTTLAHLLSQAGYTFALAHCNYQLRGEASDADAAFVQELARQLDVPLHLTTVPLPSARTETSIQEEARNARYDYFRKLLDEYSYDILCTAHHLDDSLETTLINLVRGTGIAGLRGIAPRTDFPVARPLLEVSRQELLTYAVAQGIRWREDATNQEEKYLRNALRHRVVPVLRELGLSDGSLRDTLAHLRSAEQFVERGVRSVPGVTVSERETRIDRSCTALNRMDSLTLLHHLTDGMEFTADQLRQLLDTPSRVVLFTDSHRADATPELIRLAARPPRWVGGQVDALPRAVPHPLGTIFLEVVELPGELDVAATQYCRLPEGPLHLRPRQPGDRFQPLGMAGRSKKIKDVLTDDKVPPWEKDLTPLLCDASGTIVAVVGLRIANSHALTGTEDHVLSIRWKRERPGSS